MTNRTVDETSGGAGLDKLRFFLEISGFGARSPREAEGRAPPDLLVRREPGDRALIAEGDSRHGSGSPLESRGLT